MRSRGDRIFLLIVLSYLILLGFWRDHMFVNLNYQISKLYYKDTFDYSLPADMKWLENFTYSQLYYGKFPLTLVFSLLYLLPSVLFVKRFFNEGNFLRITLLTYLVLFSTSLFLFSLGYFIGGYAVFYTLSRYIMGFVQSPLLLMILFVAFKIRTMERNN